jgi:hypothetical protein
MATIDTALAQAQAALASLKGTAAAAAAGGTAQQAATEAAWKAIAAVEAAKHQAEVVKARLGAGDARLDSALSARAAALADADAQTTQGSTPPLADASATALRDDLATAAGVTGAQVDGALTDAVTAVDDAIAAIGGATDPEVAALDLTAKETALKDAEAAYATALAAADAALAAAEEAPSGLAAALTEALEQGEAVRGHLNQGAGAPAVVAYADYQGARAALAAAAADAPGAALTGAWTTAREAALARLADLLSAQLAWAEAQQRLAAIKAQTGVKQATRDADAAQAVTDAIAALAAPPPPPGP